MIYMKSLNYTCCPISSSLSQWQGREKGGKKEKKHFINSPFSNSKIICIYTHAIRYLKNDCFLWNCIPNTLQTHSLILLLPILRIPHDYYSSYENKAARWLHKRSCQRQCQPRLPLPTYTWSTHTWPWASCSAQQHHLGHTSTINGPGNHPTLESNLPPRRELSIIKQVLKSVSVQYVKSHRSQPPKVAQISF